YEMDGEKIPQVSVTASKDQGGKIHVSLCNVSHVEQSDVTIQLRGLSGAVSKIVGRQLASDSLDAHNTFESPETLKPAAFHAFEQEGDVLRAKLAPMSVTGLERTAGLTKGMADTRCKGCHADYRVNEEQITRG
ncbi:hypothetical protein GNF85_24175, partial [Clostridium perfringens]